MKIVIPTLAAALAVVCGCAAPSRPQTSAGASHVGAPDPSVDSSLVGRSLTRGNPGADAIRIPDRLMLPASYRLVLLDGHLALVRETDPQALEPAPASMRILTGEIARGELAYQPGLLPQELAAEVAANRESSARMDNALEAVMRRSRELSAQALEVQAQSRKLAELLAAEEAKVRDLEAAARGAQAKAPARADDSGPPE
jgi:hypothetical protein